MNPLYISRSHLILIILYLLFISCSANELDSKSQAEQAILKIEDELTDNNLRNAGLNGDLQTVREAIEQGISVDEPDELGRTALMFAAFNGHSEVIRLLLDQGVQVNHRNDEGWTPLMFVASGSFPEIVLMLLDEGAEVNVQDSIEGWSALMYAAAEGNREVIKILLDHGADALLEDNDGETATDFAANNGHSQTAALLNSSLTQ